MQEKSMVKKTVKAVSEDQRYSDEEVSMFFGALASARDQFGLVTKELAREYEIGPRGPWIVGLIGREPASPNELATFFNTGRSLITAELRQLQDAGLINYDKSDSDGRKIRLSLTAAGDKLRRRITINLNALLEARLSAHPKDEVMACARLLSDFAGGNHYGQLNRATQD